MKLINALVMILCAFLLFTCGQPEVDVENENLAELKERLEEKREAEDELKQEIQLLEERIAQLDTTAQIEGSLITVIQVPRTSFKHYTTVQGEVKSDDIVNASPEVSGRISSLNVEEGDLVRRGALVAVLDLESIAKQIAELETSLELAREVYERQARLWAQKIGSEIQYLEAKNNKERLERSLETLKLQQSKANVYAPLTGVIDEVFLKEGELAPAGSPIVRILNTRDLKIVADLPEDLLGTIERGETVTVRYPALGEESEGRVTLIGSKIDQSNRTFKVEVKPGKSNPLLKPNLLAEIDINDYSIDSAFVLPIELVQQEVSGRNFVMVVDSTEEGLEATKKYITTGESFQGDIVVEEGLEGKETIIQLGARSISEGEKVRIRENARPEPLSVGTVKTSE